MKRLVLFVEGEGESEAAPKLIKKFLTAQNAWDCVILDEYTFRVGHIAKLVKNDCSEWKRYLAASRKRRDIRAVLLLVDGDLDRLGSEEFCVVHAAKVDPTATAPTGDLEQTPRDAKGWINDLIEGGYKATRDQAVLTEFLEIDIVRQRGLRCFRRLESAVAQLVTAIREDNHVSSPC